MADSKRVPANDTQIQIIGYRDYVYQGVVKQKHAFFDRMYRAPSLNHLFKNLNEYLEKIPLADQWNLHLTVHNCHEGVRKFAKGTCIYFDIDGINPNLTHETADFVLNLLGVDPTKTAVNFSGHGLHIYIDIGSYEQSFLVKTKGLYKYTCQRIDFELDRNGFSGKCDVGVWEHARTLRLPGTINRKEGKEDVLSYQIYNNLEKQDFSFEKFLGIPTVLDRDQISPIAMAKMPSVDTNTILNECEFLKHCKSNQSEMLEPTWYAMLGIVAWMDDAKNLAIEYSNEHPDFNEALTLQKLEQAKTTAGPRTCKNIDFLWDGCSGCKHFGKVKSPILIAGEEFIKTERSGFMNVSVTNTGALKHTPNYADLLKYFKREHPYIVQEDTNLTYVFNDKYWECWSNLRIKSFAEKHFNPEPCESQRTEFLNKVLCNNLKPREWSEGSANKKLCLENGVFDIETKEILPHSKDYFFTGCLPYSYDARAKAPRFMQFLEEVTLGRKELQKSLLEFAGYAISGDEYWLHKCLILNGTGSNGKSTFIEVLKALVGPDLYSSLSLSALEKDQMRFNLIGKHFNVGEETNKHSLNRSEMFKTLSAGGEVDVKKVYHAPFTFRNRAKLIFACNELPYSSDTSDGFYRRLLIVPFDAKFGSGNTNMFLKEELLKELPGILNIVTDAYRDLYKRKHLEMGEVLNTQVEEYKQDQEYNYFAEWFEEKLQENPQGSFFLKEAYDSFLHFLRGLNVDVRDRRFTFPIFKKKMLELELSGELPPQKKVQKGNGHEGRTRQLGYHGYMIKHGDVNGAMF